MKSSANAYPLELRESVARRYLASQISYRELAREVGCSSWSVRMWVRELKECGGVGKRKTKQKPVTTDSHSPQDKLRLLLQYQAVPEAERGEFLRREGLHDEDLERWEQEALGGLGSGPSSEMQERRVRELEHQNKKQGKRLKEATALLELQKKVQALWGDEDESTSQR